MKVANILASKGHAVVTVRPNEKIETVAHRLRLERIGAAVVSPNGRQVLGIISEREIVYGMAEYGRAVLEKTAADLMSKSVVTSAPSDTIAAVMQLITHRRVRHLPVLDGDALVGIISIGDVVKHRLDEIEAEANVLRDYAVATR